MELSSLQAVSVQYKDQSRDEGRVEFIYKYFKTLEHRYKTNSIITPLIKNISNLVQIIDSIFKYYGDTEQRLITIENKTKTKDYNEFYELNRVQTLRIYDDHLVLITDSSTQEFKFNENLYIGYEQNIIVIKSSFNEVDDEIAFGPVNNILGILELLYLKFLSWKKNSGLLLDIEKLLTMEDEQKYLNNPEQFNKGDLLVEPYLYSRRQLLPFLGHLSKNEEIILLYASKKRNDSIKKIMLFIFICLIIYFLIFPIVGVSQDFLFFYVSFCSIIFFPIILGFFQKYMKFAFTSQRFILTNSNVFYSTPYNNIIAITYNDRITTQKIEVHLKNPIEGSIFESDIKITMLPPKKLNLFLRIIKLRLAILNIDNVNILL